MLTCARLAICSFALVLFSSAVPVQAAPADDVGQRAEALYHALLEKNVRHMEIRRILSPFFLTDDEMSAFLIRLTRLIDNKGIYNNKIESRKVTVLEVDSAYGFAETRADIAGDWLLWFNRSIDKTDRWKLVDDVWYVNPPPLTNLEFTPQ